MATGARLTLCGFLAIVAFGLAAWFIASCNRQISLIPWIIIFASRVYSTWLLTERNPTGLRERKTITARRIVRGAALIGFAFVIIEAYLSSALVPPDLSSLLTLINILVASVQLLAELIYLEFLAKRIPDRRLTWWARFLWRTFGVSLGAVLVAATGIFLSMLIRGLVSTVAVTVCLRLGFVGLLGMAVFSIMALFLVYRMSKALRAQAFLARQIWATTAAAASAPAQP